MKMPSIRGCFAPVQEPEASNNGFCRTPLRSTLRAGERCNLFYVYSRSRYRFLIWCCPDFKGLVNTVPYCKCPVPPRIDKKLPTIPTSGLGTSRLQGSAPCSSWSFPTPWSTCWLRSGARLCSEAYQNLPGCRKAIRESALSNSPCKHTLHVQVIDM